MQQAILPEVIFSPGQLALDLAVGLRQENVDVTLLTPGAVETSVKNVTADLSDFEHELLLRGDTYIGLLKKHPFTFITLARQVQSELIAKAYDMANRDELDIVHIYTNEEDTALPFARLCRKPVVFTHHDPFNFLVKYKNVFPKYKQLNWLSISLAQRRGMPADTNWVGNIYHGFDAISYQPILRPKNLHNPYIAFLGRIIQPKGAHLAIAAVKAYNAAHPACNLTLKLAGKHYSGQKDDYWRREIEPLINDKDTQYLGFIDNTEAKLNFLASANALIVPSLFQEPFGMVMIEALACGTPVIGLDSGAIPEVVRDGVTGFVVAKSTSEQRTIHNLNMAIGRLAEIDRTTCRQDYESRFTLRRMIREHKAIYERLTTAPAVL